MFLMTCVTIADRLCVDRPAGSAAMWWSTLAPQARYDEIMNVDLCLAPAF